MTTIRARVHRSTVVQGAWITTAFINDTPDDVNVSFSWPEAMQQAHAMLASLDRALANDLHASRARRRIEATP